MNMNGYRCIRCTGTQVADFAGFLCPQCGGNLDITYDYAAVAQQIDGSLARAPGDLFRFSALLPLNASSTPLSLRVGGTPLYPSQVLAGQAGVRELYLKDDTLNPSASLKDRASAVCIARARDVGAETVSVASTGNAGSSLACLAAATGLQAVVFVPASAPVAKLTQMLAFGARVLAVQGSYDDAYDLCLAASEEFGWFNRSTGFNAYTREGKKTCAYEIWQDLDGKVPDRVLVSTGDGNTLSAIWKGWCDLKAVGLIDRVPRIDCVQSTDSAAISQTVQRVRSDNQAVVDWSAVEVQKVNASTIADSISVDRPRDGLAAVKAVIESGGEVVTVSDEEILRAIPEMARASGVFAEPAAAAPWAGLKQLVTEKRIGAGERVVCIVSGSGLKDIAGSRKAVGEPHLIEPSLEAVRECGL
ncbi:MAG: threonine synthase [Gammaproteobacteria bacterium]|nr:threonine synthase [Gammaproteobacteria bacterium]MBT8076249.1 threonine synthase [Gammaproteobacteria bacterium]NNK98350.1 threonine synthase [Xanthomonadales bacterium]